MKYSRKINDNSRKDCFGENNADWKEYRCPLPDTKCLFFGRFDRKTFLWVFSGYATSPGSKGKNQARMKTRESEFNASGREKITVTTQIHRYKTILITCRILSSRKLRAQVPSAGSWGVENIQMRGNISD